MTPEGDAELLASAAQVLLEGCTGTTLPPFLTLLALDRLDLLHP